MTPRCPKHNSHFCPCLAPRIYAGDAAAAAMWDMTPAQQAKALLKSPRPGWKRKPQ